MSVSFSKSLSLRHDKSLNNEEKNTFSKKFNTTKNNEKKFKIDPIENFQIILEEKNKAMESLDYLDDIDEEKSSVIYIINNIEIISSAFASSASQLISDSESKTSSYN